MASHPPDAISDDVFFDQIFSSSCAPPPGGALPAPMFSSLAGGFPTPEDASGGGRRFWEVAEASAEAEEDCLFPVFGHVQSHQVQPNRSQEEDCLFPVFGHVQSHQVQPNRSQAVLHGQATQGSRVAAAPHQPAAPRPRVRARRGQATDPHSIAERLRRERIAERMRALQELVPNFNKPDRAAMLDEIVDYVKFLRLQVKVLSMSRLGRTGAVAQLIADIPLQSIEGELVEGRSEQQVWEKWSNDGTEQQVAKLMEEDVGAAMQFLQSKALCMMPISLATSIFHSPSHHHYNAGPPLGKPEPNAPS